ncbi:MAG: GTP 3',8-cyclase MoaA [Dehalococcoidia bacterium]|nr:MAG: GTP 3',8-cyclase MoaA [Dehalococcoidia bacterium]
MTRLSDSFQRPLNYLRISVTDRCNLRCTYCMPSEGISLMPHEDILSYEEICIVARAAAELGIVKVRLTGGEPLVRAELTNLVAMLARIEGIDDISLTTNAVLLQCCADELKSAGLRRVNVSLDSLRSDRFQRITRVGNLDDVLGGIEAARQAGLDPVKTNTVVVRGMNDDEVLDFARLTIEDEWHVRFIEYMPFSNGKKMDHLLVPVSEMKQRIETLSKLEPSLSSGGGPARYFRLPGARGTIGFISPVSEHFCRSCNRLRLTADGKLRPCLFSDTEIDLREPLRQGAAADDIKRLIQEAASCKPEGHKLRAGITCERFMVQIGG